MSLSNVYKRALTFKATHSAIHSVCDRLFISLHVERKGAIVDERRGTIENRDALLRVPIQLAGAAAAVRVVVVECG